MEGELLDIVNFINQLYSPDQQLSYIDAVPI